MRGPGAHGGRVVAALVVAVLALSSCTAVVEGRGSPGPYTPDPRLRLAQSGVDLHDILDSDPNATNAYWSDERLAGAETNFQDPSDGESQVALVPSAELIVQPTVGNTSQVDPEAIGSSTAGDAYDLPGLADRTIGKLFFVQGGLNYVCSAAVVSSASGSTIATASHCLYDVIDSRLYSSQILFIPGYDTGAEPYGRWTVNAVAVPPEYTGAADWPDAMEAGGDTGFARLDLRDGQTAEQVLGAQGIAFGYPPESIIAVGWPAEESELASFDGETARFCADQTWTQRYQVDYTIDCLMNGGASGGPWLTRYDPTLGAGYVIGVSSNGNRSQPYLQGAIYGQIARDMYEAVNR